MLIIAGRIEIDPTQRDRAAEAARQMMEGSNAEPGCIEYTISADLRQDDLFHIFERWEDQAALDAHFKTPHMGVFQEAIKSVVRGMKIHKYSAEAGGPLSG